MRRKGTMGTEARAYDVTIESVSQSEAEMRTAAGLAAPPGEPSGSGQAAEPAVGAVAAQSAPATPGGETPSAPTAQAEQQDYLVDVTGLGAAPRGRIAEITRKYRDLERELRVEREQHARTRGALEAVTPSVTPPIKPAGPPETASPSASAAVAPPPAADSTIVPAGFRPEPAEPLEGDFEDYEEFRKASRKYQRDMIVWEVDRREALGAQRQREQAEQTAKAASEAAARQNTVDYNARGHELGQEHPDTDQVLAAGMAALHAEHARQPFADQPAQDLMREIIEARDAHGRHLGPDIQYYLARHQDEAVALLRSPSPRELLRQFGAVKAKVEAARAGTRPPSGPPAPIREVSHVPVIEPERHAARATNPSALLDVKGGNVDEYLRAQGYLNSRPS